MRGLCAGSVMDRLYRLITDQTDNRRRYFYGPSGWKLGWLSEEKLWRISNERYPGVTANVTVAKYPLGSNTWRISGGDGCEGETYSAMLTLSACNDDQFACDDGLCVDMNTRQAGKYVITF